MRCQRHSEPGRTDQFQAGLLDRLPEPPRSVALVCASRIGDFVCATPAFRAFRKRLPAASFTLVGQPFVGELAVRTPYLDRFEPFPGFPGIGEQFFDARRATGFFRRMQRRSFDLAVQMHGSGVYSNPFTLMLGAAVTAGFVRPGDSAGRLDAALPWPGSLPAARRALSLAEFLGCAGCGYETEFRLLPEDHAAADSLLRGLPRPLIGIHPGAREVEKIWPLDYFRAAASFLAGRLSGSVVVVGGPKEEQAGLRITEALPGQSLNTAGARPLGVMGAVISRLSLLVTTDSGPAHIAYALGRPTVTLFGTTDPSEWPPPARPWHRVLRAPQNDLAALPVADVVQSAVEAFGAAQGDGIA